jgi:hypothetical protein
MSMSEHHDVDSQVEGALADAARRQPELPDGFTPSVMQGVQEAQRHLSPWRRWRRARRAANFSHSTRVVSSHSHLGGDTVSKKILWGVMGVGATAAVAAFFLGIPPIGDGTAGTIGAAKRFQGKQMTDKDVVVGPVQVRSIAS